MRRSHVTTVSLLMATVLCGCTRANDVLDPSAIKPTAGQAAPVAQGGAAPTVPAMPATQPASTATPAQSAAVMARIRLQIAPIVGPTVEAATPLTERLGLRARERGLALTGSSGAQTPTHVLKGYFSAVSEGPDTTVIYVWDVYDPAGNRLHRINGQQKAPSVKGGDGWTAVAPATMQAIADAAIEQLAAWLAANPG
ncbi:MAG TPA: hypothetical protein VGM46_03465 [Mesorhizobium sp.]